MFYEAHRQAGYMVPKLLVPITVSVRSLNLSSQECIQTEGALSHCLFVWVESLDQLHYGFAEADLASTAAR